MTTTARILFRRFALGAVFACLAPLGALAEPESGRSPSWLEERVDSLEKGLSFFGREEKPATPSGNVRTAQSSLADISVRLDRLENQMRQINGRLDELQYQGRKNDEALKRFQGDVDFRFQDIEGKGGSGGGSSSAKPTRRGDTGDLGGSQGASTAGIDRSGGGAGAGAPPSTLGQTRSGDAIGGLIEETDDPNAPMSIRPPGAGRPAGDDRMAAREPAMSTGVGTGSARDTFDLGVGYVQRRDYGQAEATFRDFLREHPTDPKAAEARYWLGESLYQRKKYTDAADSFLTNFKEAPNSSKAPESMLKLGMSLNGMGKKEEACATIAEAGRKYSRIKAQSDRELKRIAC